MFWNNTFTWKYKYFASEKVAKNVAISMDYFIFTKNHYELQKAAQIWSPCLKTFFCVWGGGGVF